MVLQNKCTSKEFGNRNNRDKWRQRFYPKFHCPKETNPRSERCGAPRHSNARTCSPILLAYIPRGKHPPTSEVFFRVLTKSVQIVRVYLHNYIGGSRSLSEASQLEELCGTTNRLGCIMHPRGTSSQEHNTPKSNKLLNFHFHESPRRTQIDAPNVMARTHWLVNDTYQDVCIIFDCSMFVSYHYYMFLPSSLVMLGHFIVLTYWQDAQCQFPVFCYFVFQKILFGKSPQNWLKIYGITFMKTRRRSPEGSLRGHLGTPARGSRVGPALPLLGPFGPFRLL